jgi:hypothetical protein
MERFFMCPPLHWYSFVSTKRSEANIDYFTKIFK